MTQPPTRHEALERYLTLATWGLWGSNKHTLRLELESHVRHKAWKYQVQGLNEHEAIQKAIEDLGQAQIICAGMNGVYTMPNMIRQTFMVGLLMSLGVAGFHSSAQIASLGRPDCFARTPANRTVPEHHPPRNQNPQRNHSLRQ